MTIEQKLTGLVNQQLDNPILRERQKAETNSEVAINLRRTHDHGASPSVRSGTAILAGPNK